MSQKKTKRRVATIIALLLLLLWWFWPTDPLATVHGLQAELFGNDGQALPAELRQAKFAELRTELSKLTHPQRVQLAAERQKRMQDRMAKYFDMSPEEKKQFLDQQIDQSLQGQQQPPSGGRRGGGAGSGPPPASPEDKEKRRQERLDQTTPEFRAQMDQFRRDMAQRRQERGLPPGRG